MTDTQLERWTAGDAYEHFMGRWSREIAGRFLQWLNVAPGRRWLDVGCGTGALTQTIAETTQPDRIIGLDPSWDFVRYAMQQTPEGAFLVADGSMLAIGSETFDAVISGLVLNFIPRPDQALTEMRRVVKPGGIVAAYVWDYAGKMEFLRYFWDAAVAFDAGAATMHEGQRFPICQPEPLRQMWQAAGFTDVSVDAIDICTRFDDFDSYWRLFTRGSFPAPVYALSLDDVQRNRLRDRLRTVIPTEHDGSINLIARVWAAFGYR